MATFYHTHNTVQIPTIATTTGHDQVNHSYILMNPNFDSGYPGPHHQEGGVTLYGHPQAGMQGLSLSLLSSSSSSQQQHAPYNNNNGAQLLAHVEEGDVAQHSVIMRSKYLKAAQELLEEVVNVGDRGGRGKNSDSNNKWGPPQQPPRKGNGELCTDEKADAGEDGGESVQLSSAERHELQMKKAKLVTMLDETEQRYRQYHNQMQILIHSFEQVAGVGSAKTYTALALKTISKQFRCLKDAIQVQIKATGKRLGESGGSGLSSSGKIEGSRLKYIDHQIRQQRALQQLGMMQNHNAWRPQRGLPEPAVSLLRAWLFEHFLHPYPKDSDKIMLAKQTGLTRSQVSNWFINARVRLWKPMIEEMYSEEIKEQEQNSCSEEQKPNSNQSNSANNKEKNTTNTTENQPNNTLKNQNIIISSPSSSLPFKGNVFSFSGSMEMEGVSSHGSPKRPRNDEILNCGSTETELFTHELESYPSLGEMGRYNYTHDGYQPRFFQGNKGISLSLGLPPCENQQLNLAATTNHTFLSMSHNIQFRRTNDFGSMNINTPPQHSTPSAYECLDIQNRKGFAAQLLPDFVA